jgi:hypothetical protein
MDIVDYLLWVEFSKNESWLFFRGQDIKTIEFQLVEYDIRMA